MDKKRLVVMASGRGTNLKALIDADKEQYFKGKIICVISDNKDAKALQIAREHDIEAVVVSPDDFEGKRDFNQFLIKELQKREADFILLAGYMRIIPKTMIQSFKYRILNIHPSLLPAFRGLDAQRQAIEYGVKVSGCTVHFVDAGVDTGPIILQSAVSISEEDNEETLSKKILAEEHKTYREAVKLLLDEKLDIIGRKVKILD